MHIPHPPCTCTVLYMYMFNNQQSSLIISNQHEFAMCCLFYGSDENSRVTQSTISLVIHLSLPKPSLVVYKYTWFNIQLLIELDAGLVALFDFSDGPGADKICFLNF